MAYRRITEEERRLIYCWLREDESQNEIARRLSYTHIYADAKAGGALWKNLPRAKRKRRRRCPRQDGRGRGQIPNQRRIDTRPAEVETRLTVGHWEGHARQR